MAADNKAWGQIKMTGWSTAVERSATVGQRGVRLRQCHTKGRRCGDGSERGSVGARQSSRGWAGSCVIAEGHGNREAETEERRRSYSHPSSALDSMILAQPY